MAVQKKRATGQGKSPTGGYKLHRTIRCQRPLHRHSKFSEEQDLAKSDSPLLLIREPEEAAVRQRRQFGEQLEDPAARSDRRLPLQQRNPEDLQQLLSLHREPGQFRGDSGAVPAVAVGEADDDDDVLQRSFALSASGRSDCERHSRALGSGESGEALRPLQVCRLR